MLELLEQFHAVAEPAVAAGDRDRLRKMTSGWRKRGDLTACCKERTGRRDREAVPDHHFGEARLALLIVVDYEYMRHGGTY
jgi:hypothetical protein